MSTASIEIIGGPTTLVRWAGLRVLTDPTFDPPGSYPIGNRTLTKTTGPRRQLDEVGHIDVVLLSHDQHPDHLDTTGRSALSRAATVVSTPEAASRIGGVVGLEPWQTLALPDAPVPDTVVTAVPARHGPPGCEPLTGTVTGFVMQAPGWPAVYVSGDNADTAVAAQVTRRLGTVDLAILHLGVARTALIDAPLTMGAAEALDVARAMPDAVVYPVHVEGWAHFTEGPAAVLETFERAGMTGRLGPGG